jgi:5'-3' exoribonuclease 2
MAAKGKGKGKGKGKAAKKEEEQEEEFEGDESSDDDEEVALGVQEAPLTAEEEAAKVRMKQILEKKARQKLDDHSKNVVDTVKLHEAGWRERYYTDKCKAEDITGRGGKEELFKEYVVGLCWVMKYYYSGVASWK